HYIGILAIITRLKQICDHPCLLEGSRDWGMYESGKWDLLLELLEECRAGDKKVVVFSQFTRMLDILESYLDAQGVEYAALRGHLSPGARQQAIKRFNTEKSCMVCCASLPPRWSSIMTAGGIRPGKSRQRPGCTGWGKSTLSKLSNWSPWAHWRRRSTP
ncbi:MAG TPA: DEAD/DEAH box helicase, partial [Desulfobacteraceae bacterium]|nr:DEAD/DEAH box helicase [Desulfobacteraceae bacterium]